MRDDEFRLTGSFTLLQSDYKIARITASRRSTQSQRRTDIRI